jgi:hypothetical protein
MDEGLSQLEEDVGAVDEEMAAEGALPYGADIRAEYESARQAYETSTQSVLDQIQKARDLLLSQPTQKSKGEMLRGLAMSLAAPRERNDPRFYEKRNLYTFLRDVGEYGTAEAEAQKKAELAQKEQMLKLDELAAKYGQQSALERLKAVGPLYREMMKPKKDAELPADIRTVEYWEKVRDDESQPPARRQYASDMLEKIRRVPSERGEADPNRPSSVVIGRVTGVVNRDLNPIGARLGALNETRAAIANARTNPAQVPQVDRFFARLSGDSQLSQLEVNAVANAGSFPSRISNQLSKFFTGVPTDLSLDDKARVLDVLEDVLAPSYNTKRNQIINQFSVASDISPEIVEKIAGPRYSTAAERKRLLEQTVSAPPAEAIEFLKKNPSLAADFDKKYGAGASKKYLEQ